MKRMFLSLVILSLLSLSPIGMGEEWSYSVALEVGDSFEFEHTRSLDVVKNGSTVSTVSENFIANVTVDAIYLVNVIDDVFGNYTDMVISSSVAVGNETLNAIVKGLPIPRPGIPESFKVLLRELMGLGLEIHLN